MRVSQVPVQRNPSLPRAARYFSGAQGRFTSPDQPLVDQNPFNPQSWNIYSYGRNNPLTNTDPTGRCSQGSDGKMHDDADGRCADVTSVTVTEKAPKVRDLVAEANAEMTRMQFEAWRRNQQRGKDVPLSPRAQQAITAIANAAPAVCGGGVYAYYGTEFEAGPVSSFSGAIVEADSRAGVSRGGLQEVGVGEGVVMGGGVIVSPTESGKLGASGIVYGGVGIKTPAISASAGTVGFTSGAGVYGDLFVMGQGGGIGAYINVTTNAGCNKGGH